MKWLQDNPLGMVLAGISGLFVLFALGMAIVWNLPVSTETAGTETEFVSDNQVSLVSRQVGTLGEYKVINEKPVFNESRLPVILELDDGPQEEDATIEVKGAPDVRLTGVVITPAMKIASLTPADTNIETVMAHEGDSLTGEFVGWQVTAVNPRAVVLKSSDGQSLELDLQVHDVKIAEPPSPAVKTPASTAQAAAGQDTDETGEDDEPLSRAEQIRQRIAERREELRLEQEAQPQNKAAAGAAEKRAPYQNAIRALMNKNTKDQGSNDKNDG
ncbi:MAG: hypothetical protein QNK22_02610 [Xanthomonadales bacterium]|nr:hypothetical protein [Xanthomonadales bacterium]